MYFANIFLALFLLLSSSIIAGLTSALLSIGRMKAKDIFRKYHSLFFFQYLMRPLFGKKKWEGLLLTLSFSKHVLHLCYGVITLFILLTLPPFSQALKITGQESISLDTLWVIAAGAIIVILSLLFDVVMKFIAASNPLLAFKLFAPIASLFLTIFSPFTTLYLRAAPSQPSKSSDKARSSLREKLLEVLYESDLSSQIDSQDRKLILSVASFRERNAREVMVPRIDVFSLSDETTIAEAAKIFLREGYSRIPIYRESIDYVTGVLLYKDVVAAYAQKKEGPIHHLIKPVLYAPETKKISILLQEFRSKQIHLAIVVDEYGGTEGIVTIEDILEELVGEIGDEYDAAQEQLYSVLPSGGWIVDARMTILDIEKELGVQVPQSAEYDTIGGYIFHKAGTIPSRGWRMHHNDFDLEILSSDERSIEKVKIIPYFQEE